METGRSRRFVRAAWMLLVCAAACLPAYLPPPIAAARTTTVATIRSDANAPIPTQQVVRRTSRSDPEQEYFLYVPKAGGQGAALFVTVHGISRNAAEHATLFSQCAETYGVVLLAPVFPEKKDDDYQRLGRSGHGRRADLALDALIREVSELTGAASEKIYLFGFSGGAQFAHRYVMAHPEHVARAAIGAAGWYTFPDERTEYPYGIGPTPDLPSVRFDPEAFLRVPMTVFVGEADLTNESLRRNETVDAQQGVTRLERARNWVAAMRQAAEARHLEPLVTVQSVPGIHHSFKQFMLEGELGDKVFGALFGPPGAKRTANVEVVGKPAGGER